MFDDPKYVSIKIIATLNYCKYQWLGIRNGEEKTLQNASFYN